MIEQIAVTKGQYYETGVLPSYAPHARNVRGLTVNNVRFEVVTQDLRPVVVFDHVQDAVLHGLSAQGNKSAESMLRFADSSDVLLSAPRLLRPLGVFLRVEGLASDGITTDGGNLSKASAPVAFGIGAPEKSVRVRE